MLTQAMVWDVWRGVFKDVDIFVINRPTNLKHCLPTTSTSNPFLCAADFFLQLGSCKEAVR